MILHGWRDHAVGPAGDCLATAAHPIVPWIASHRDSQSDGWNNFAFGSFDSADRLVKPVIAVPGALTDTTAANANVELSGKSLTISSDVAVNSLVLSNQGDKSKLLGEGRTLTVASGGLILHVAGTSIGEEDGGAANGALVLGDAAHPAYVWAKSADATKPNAIWAPVTAPGGFVAVYTGYLTLGGNQTNILDEVVVNAGTLQLGTAQSACHLARDLPIRIFANATLRIPNDGSTAKSVLRLDGAAGWFGKIDLPDGVAASCKKAFWRDYPETPEWQSLERGFYGSSDSGVEALATVTHPAFVRDDLFTGTGTLKVVSDERINPTILILR